MLKGLTTHWHSIIPCTDISLSTNTASYWQGMAWRHHMNFLHLYKIDKAHIDILIKLTRWFSLESGQTIKWAEVVSMLYEMIRYSNYEVYIFTYFDYRMVYSTDSWNVLLSSILYSIFKINLVSIILTNLQRILKLFESIYYNDKQYMFIQK